MRGGLGEGQGVWVVRVGWVKGGLGDRGEHTVTERPPRQIVDCFIILLREEWNSGMQRQGRAEGEEDTSVNWTHFSFVKELCWPLEI